MKFLFLQFTFLVFLSTVSAQRGDTASNKIPESWKRPHLGLQLGFGIQKTFFADFGISLQKYTYHRSGVVATNYYAAFEWIPATKDYENVNGIKIGAELLNNAVVGAIELKWLRGDSTRDFVITPKYGLGIGLVNLFYGFNISTNKYPFPGIRKHQFSLVFNTNLLFYHMKKKK